MKIVNNFISYVPREALTATFGVTLAAASSVAVQIIVSSSESSDSTLMRNFTIYSCGAGGIIGIVMSIYSMVRLCKKVVSDKDSISTSIAVTALGGLSSALIQTIGEHFWKLAPSFYWLDEHSMGYAIATNFAWKASAIAGVSGLVFTAYGAYRTGVAILNQTKDEANA